MKRNENGFGVLPVLLVILVVGAIGGAGWAVLNNRKDHSLNNVSSIQESQTSKNKDDDNKDPKLQAEEVTFVTDTGVAFVYPKEYELKHISWEQAQKEQNMPSSRGYMETTSITIPSKQYENVYATIHFDSDVNSDEKLTFINPVIESSFKPLNDKELELYSHTFKDTRNGYHLSLGKSKKNIVDKKGYYTSICVIINGNQGSDKYLEQVTVPLEALDVVAKAKQVLATVYVK